MSLKCHTTQSEKLLYCLDLDSAKMTDEPTDQRLPTENSSYEAERFSPRFDKHEGIKHALCAERDQVLVTLRHARERLNNISHRMGAASETQSLIDRALGDLDAAEGRCVEGRIDFMSLSALTAAVSAADTLAASLQGATGATAKGREEALSEVRTSLLAVHRDLFEKKIFDPYLKFTSADDEQEYRRREKERKDEIEALQKTGTPASLRRAAQLMGDQINDAGEHGATASPDFTRMQSAIATDLKTLDNITLPSAQKPEKSPPSSIVANDDIGAALAAAGVCTSPIGDGTPTPATTPIAKSGVRQLS